MLKKKTLPSHDKTGRIGNVAIRHLQVDRTDAPVYCDGGEERRLYENFAGNKNYGNKKNDMKFSSWIEQYHLSPIRQNLLKWFPFDPEGTALEVGAGCGALTGVLSQKLKKVTALEYSEQRAMITAMRHSHCSNLEIVVGGLQDFSVENKFDYITVIGVLEYAGKFYIGENPYESFLTKLRGMLNPKGTLILAIENKIGLKYLCGAKEDHTELIFESIYDYPHTNDVKTFSKRELSDLLHTVGFSSLQWYYPLPDYKLPQQVFSEDTLPCDPDLAWNLFPKGSRGKYMMSEKRLGKTLTKAGLFGEFANSFLIVANIENLPKESMCLQFIGANMHKKRKFRTNKKICWSGGEKTFVVSPDNDESIEFTHKIVEKESLAKSFFGQNAEVVSAELKNDSLIYPYISFPAMHELIAQEIKKGDTEFGKYWIDQYIHFLLKLPSKKCIPEEFMKELGIPESEIREPIHCLNCGIFDCIPHNVMIDTKTGKYYVIDNEFTYDFPIPVDFLIWRAINTLVFDLQGIIQSYVCPKHPVVIFSGHGINRHYIPETWLNILRKLEIPPKQQARWSSAFQSRILRYKVKINLRLKTKSKTLGYVPIAEINTNHRLIEQIYKILGKVRRIL